MLLALVPKCGMCVLGYAIFAAGLRVGGPEICGAPAGGAGHWLAWLPAVSLAGGMIAWLACRRRHTGRVTFGDKVRAEARV